jgi:hypothetical protein
MSAQHSALTTCPDCGTAVSRRAAACPKCAAPLSGATTIEQTAKTWKAIQAAGALVMLLGTMLTMLAGWNWWMGGNNLWLIIGVAMTALGLTVYASGKIPAWWYHG